MELEVIKSQTIEDIKEDIRREVLGEIATNKNNSYNYALSAVGKKYQRQLTSINGGQTWDTIRKITCYLVGERFTRNINFVNEEKAIEIAEFLCQEVIKAFKCK